MIDLLIAILLLASVFTVQGKLFWKPANVDRKLVRVPWVYLLLVVALLLLNVFLYHYGLRMANLTQEASIFSIKGLTQTYYEVFGTSSCYRVERYYQYALTLVAVSVLPLLLYWQTKRMVANAGKGSWWVVAILLLLAASLLYVTYGTGFNFCMQLRQMANSHGLSFLLKADEHLTAMAWCLYVGVVFYFFSTAYIFYFIKRRVR